MKFRPFLSYALQHHGDVYREIESGQRKLSMCWSVEGILELRPMGSVCVFHADWFDTQAEAMEELTTFARAEGLSVARVATRAALVGGDRSDFFRSKEEEAAHDAEVETLWGDPSAWLYRHPENAVEG